MVRFPPLPCQGQTSSLQDALTLAGEPVSGGAAQWPPPRLVSERSAPSLARKRGTRISTLRFRRVTTGGSMLEAAIHDVRVPRGYQRSPQGHDAAQADIRAHGHSHAYDHSPRHE